MDVRADMLVNAEHCLMAGCNNKSLHRRLNVAEQPRDGKALCEEGVTARYHYIASHARVGSDKGVEAAAGEAEAQDVARCQARKALEEQLRGQLGEFDDGVFRLVAHYFAPLHALGARELEKQRRCPVLQWLFGFAVADAPQHLR